jgi:hypothetical protein
MLTFFSIYHVLYFIQECAEYNLLLAFIPWTIYFFFNVLTNKSWKNIILFIVFSILPIYSQYGAAFAILPMLLLVFLDTTLSKDWYSLKKILIGYNDLATTNPKLASEWNYDKNDDLKPEDFTANSEKKVWWKCEKGHEWQATIASRNHGRGCPICYKEKRKQKNNKGENFEE